MTTTVMFGDPCAGCGRPLASRAALLNQPSLQATHVRHAAHGRCTSCYGRHKYAAHKDQTVTPPRPPKPAAPAKAEEPETPYVVNAALDQAAAAVVARYALDDADRRQLLDALGLTA